MEKEQAYKILNRTTIDALGTYGFREKFLGEMSLLMSNYGNNHHSPNGKNILERLEDLVLIVYSDNPDQKRIIQNFTDDVNRLRLMLGDFKVNHGTVDYYTPQEKKRGYIRRNHKKKSEGNTDFSNLFFDGLKKNPYPIDLLKILPEKEREELKKNIESEKNEVFKNIEIAKIGIYRTLAENQICYLFLNKHLDYLIERNGIRNILRNYDGIKGEAKEITIKKVKLFKENIGNYFGKINSAKKNLEAKTELNSLSSALAEYLINNFSPIHLNKLTKEIFAEYDSLLELVEEEQRWNKHGKEVSTDLKIKIDNCVKKIEPNKTIDTLLSEGVELKKYQEQITKERNKIMYLFLGFAVEIATKFSNSKWLKRNPKLSKEDVIQEAIIGLISASQNASFYTNFISYAEKFIKNEIIIRANKSAREITPSSAMIGKIINYSQFKHKALINSNRKPTNEEILRETRLTQEDTSKIRLIMKEPMSLNSSTGDDDTELVNTIPDPEAINPLEEIIKSENLEKIRQAISELKGAYAKIIMLRYDSDSGDPMTLDEIGERFGTGRENIRQKEEKAINQLRKKLEILGITV